jgi:hypothetical protein
MLRWWMRVIGVFYLLKFVAVAFVKGPIRGQAPEAIGLAAAGDHVARFLADCRGSFAHPRHYFTQLAGSRAGVRSARDAQ